MYYKDNTPYTGFTVFPPCRLKICIDSNPATARGEGNILGMVQKQVGRKLEWFMVQNPVLTQTVFLWTVKEERNLFHISPVWGLPALSIMQVALRGRGG